MNKILFSLCTIVLIAFTACIKVPEPTPTDPTPLAEGEVPDGFDFRTSYTQNIAIQAIDEYGEPMYRIRFYLFSAPPEEGGKIIASGLTDENGYYRASVEVTTHQQALYAYTPYLDLVRAQRIELNGELVEHVWGTDPYPDPGLSYKTAIDTTFGCNPTFYQVIGNELKKLDVVSGTYTAYGAASSNYNGIGYNEEDGMIYGFKKNGNDINLWRLTLSGAEVDLGGIAEINPDYSGGNFKGDFDLNGDLYNIFTSGGNIHLGRLNIDSLPLTGYNSLLTNLNGATSSMHDIAYNDEYEQFYSVGQNGHLLIIDHNALTIQDVGDYSSTVGTGPFGAVWCINTGEVFFSQNNTGNIYRADLDGSGLPTNVELQLVGESNSNNDGAGCVLAESPFTDTDGDKIPNGNDDYPDDATVAYSTFSPDRLGQGTYAFEDFWPKRGDYDFNDLVMGYNYEMARDTNNQIHWVNLNFSLRALGAGFKTGFGIQLDDILPSQIASVTGTTTSTISVAANGCENGQSAAVIMVTDNAHDNFDVPVGFFVNTDSDGTNKAPVSIQVRITFTSPIADLGTINPFITTRGDRGYEIHLMGYNPTDLVNNSLFDTEGDDSGSGTYYVDTYGYPWGMQFSTEYDFPKEKIEIRTSYPQFGTWVRSRGVEQTDWYSRSKAAVDKIVIQ